MLAIKDAVIRTSDLTSYSLPGLRHQTLTGPLQGRTELEMRKQTLTLEAATPLHRHDCEELIVILSGSGQMTIDETTVAFGPNSTLFVPAMVVHQIVNTGTEDLLLLAAFPKVPRIEAPDGTPIPVPWHPAP